MSLGIDELNVLRRLLREKRKSLLRSENEIEREALSDLSQEHLDEVSLTRSHPDDLGSLEADREVAIKVAEKMLLEVQEVEAAERRMESHTYGLCEKCGDEISFPRLRAIPETRVCGTCRQEAEDELNQRRPAAPPVIQT